MKKIALFLLLISILVITGCNQNYVQPDPASFWKDGYSLQTVAETQQENSDIIRALIDGEWQEFNTVSFPENFMNWNVERRMESIDFFRNMLTGKKDTGSGPELAGPHNGIVATSGFKRKDTSFALNNAVKGMGFLPRADRIDEIIIMMEKSFDAPLLEKLDSLAYLYENAADIFDLDKQISLELYATPEFMTQSFLNQMTNPVSTIVYLDIPSYKLKTITRLIHPDDPDLTEYEKKMIKYVNLVHSYFHGHFSRDFITVVYSVIEIFDNSPRGKDPSTGMGQKILPLLP